MFAFGLCVVDKGYTFSNKSTYLLGGVIGDCIISGEMVKIRKGQKADGKAKK